MQLMLSDVATVGCLRCFYVLLLLILASWVLLTAVHMVFIPISRLMGVM